MGVAQEGMEVQEEAASTFSPSFAYNLILFIPNYRFTYPSKKEDSKNKEEYLLVAHPRVNKLFALK